MKFIGASYISSYFFSKGSFDFVNNKSISYNIYSCIIQIVKDHVVFWPVFLPLPVKYRVGERDRKLHHQHHFHSNQRTRNCLAKWTFVRSFTPNVPVVTLVMFSAKMAASFKVPSFAKRSKLGTSFPKFDWRDIEIIEELRSGTFGHVFRATFVKESGNVVIKKLKGESAESRHQFKKEGGGILNKVKGTHTGTLPSSWEFVGTHTQLWWCMDVFYFSHFGVHKKVSSLESFTCHWLRVRFHIIYRATAMCKRRRLWPRIFAQTRHYGIYAGGDMPTLFWWCPYTSIGDIPTPSILVMSLHFLVISLHLVKFLPSRPVRSLLLLYFSRYGWIGWNFHNSLQKNCSFMKYENWNFSKTINICLDKLKSIVCFFWSISHT